MPLQLKATISVSADQRSFIYYDTTGAYDATTNETGYGGPNPTVAQFLTFVISVVAPDGTTLLPTATAVPIDAYPSLPTLTSTNGFDLTSTAILGSDQVLADGWWQFTVASTWDNGDSGESTLTVNKIKFETAKCCVDQAILAFDLNCHCSDSATKVRLGLATVALAQLEEWANNGVFNPSPVDECDQYNKGVAALQYLQDVCENDCGGCATC